MGNRSMWNKVNIMQVQDAFQPGGICCTRHLISYPILPNIA